MPASYEIVLIHRGLRAFADEVEQSVRALTEEVYLQPDLVEFKDELTGTELNSHAAVVYLGNQEGATDGSIDALLKRAVESQIPVLPLVRMSDPGEPSSKLPPSIKCLNAADWDSNRGLALDTLLQMLGLTEPERKVFLSYFRREATPIAVQLHTALAEAQFSVFLDRFAVPPGANFQRRLDEDLADKAFVVLLESPGLRTSDWVEHEISYAQSHRIGLLGITLPETAAAQLVPSLDEAFRLRLREGDLTADAMLTPDALAAVLGAIQVAHASELRRRREQLLGSLRDKLFTDGCNCEPVADWAVLATALKKKPAVFLITPRRPRPEDLYQLHSIVDDVKLATGLVPTAAVIHETEHVDPKERVLIDWIGEPRRLEAMLLRGCLLADEVSP